MPFHFAKGAVMIRSASLLFVLLLSGCALTAPNYSASVENAQILRDSGVGKARVGKFQADPKTGNNESISLRGSSMTSPVGGKFTDYLEDAIRSELSAARIFDDKSDVEISGVIAQNDVSVGSISEGTGIFEARVVVKRDSQVRFDKTKSVTIKFESSFAGAVAIPKGVESYPTLVQKFLSQLYADKDFIGALK
jgi:hypothetical protein